MSDWKQKRFWKSAVAVEVEGGFAIHLDGRPLRTPAKALLVVPSRALAEAIAAEWQAQPEEGLIDPTRMPLTRTANSALDKVAVQKAEVAALLVEYGETDLLCYRAEAPQRLQTRQDEVWNPLLDWAAEALDAPLSTGQGILYVEQPEASLANLRERVDAFDHFQLAAFHDLVALSGSLVIGFAAAQGVKPVNELWAASRVDETWQEEQWGADDEATAMAAIKSVAFEDAQRFFLLHAQS